MAGYDVNRFVGLEKHISDNLMCSICLNIFKQPVFAQCGHTFCSYCIHTSIRTNGAFCPQCRDAIGSRKRTRSETNVLNISEPNLKTNYSIDGMVSVLRIKCDFEFNGCSEVVQMSSLDTHLKTCDYNFVQIRVERRERIEYKQELVVCKRQLQSSEVVRNQLQTRNQFLESTNQELGAKAKELGAKNTELVAQNEAMKERIEQLETNNSELKAKNENLEVMLKEVEKRSKVFATSNRVYEGTISVMKSRVIDLEASNKRLESEIVRLRQNDTQLREKNKELEDRNEVLETTEQWLRQIRKGLKDKLKDTEDMNKHLTDTVSELEVKCQDFEVKNKELELKNCEMEVKCKEVELESSELGVKCKQLETKYRETEVKCKESEVKNRNFEMKSRELEVKNRDMETKSRELEFKNWELEVKSKELETKTSELETKCKDLERENIECNVKNKEFEIKINELESKNRETEARNEELSAQLLELRTDNSTANTSLDTNKDTNSVINVNTTTVSGIQIKSEDTSNETMEVMDIPQKFESISSSNYILFGTYRTKGKSVEFNADTIRLKNVSANSVEEKAFRFHVMIPYIEMNQLLYCSDPRLPLIFIKPNAESNSEIQKCMNLGSNSINGFRFDINSNDMREQYIIIHLKEKISEQFVRDLCRCSAQANEQLECKSILIGKAKQIVQNVRNRNFSLQSNQ